MSQSASIRDYKLITLAALLFITVLLVQENAGWLALFPLIGGLIGVQFPGLVSPPFVLLTIFLLLALRSWWDGMWWYRQPPASLEVLLFAMSTLVYLIAHNRLLTLSKYAIPPDARRERELRNDRIKKRWFLPGKSEARSSNELSQGEFLILILSAPAFSLIAYLLWIRVALDSPPEWLDIPLVVWRILAILWVSGMCLAGFTVVSTYLRWIQSSKAECLLYLQDQAWNETRGEQRRIQSWLAQDQLAQEKKETGK